MVRHSAIPSAAESSTSGQSNHHCALVSSGKFPKRQKKGQVDNTRPPCRLIAPSLLTTEIVARSKYSLSIELLLHKKLPKPPKGASKLTYFHAILVICIYATVRVSVLASWSIRFSIASSAIVVQALLGSLLSYPHLAATLSFHSAKGLQMAQLIAGSAAVT